MLQGLPQPPIGGILWSQAGQCRADPLLGDSILENLHQIHLAAADGPFRVNRLGIDKAYRKMGPIQQERVRQEQLEVYKIDEIHWPAQIRSARSGAIATSAASLPEPGRRRA